MSAAHIQEHAGMARGISSIENGATIGDQIIDDVQTWAAEYGRENKSPSAKAAGGALSEMHRNLPEIVGTSSELLSRIGIDVGSSRTTSRRLADSVTREMLDKGEGSMDNQSRLDVVRRSLRDVLVQEAAGHELKRRSGIDPVRELDLDRTTGQGEKAMAALERQGVDVGKLLGSMTEHDLAQTSRGAYDKVSLLAHPALVKTLDTDQRIMTPEQVAMNRSINPEPAPAREMKAVRDPILFRRPPAPVRQATFGRRMAHAMSAGMGAG